MNALPESEIGRVLAGAVPPLCEPDDRLGQIRARVRRSRLRAGAAATCAVAVVAALIVPQVAGGGPPALTAPTTAAAPAGCPADWREPTFEDAGGPLVRSGAVDATLCPPDGYDGEPRLLTAGVDELVDTLNSFERFNPDDLFCVGFEGNLPGPSLVLRYPDGGTTVVYTEWRCSLSTVDGKTRIGNGVDTFRRLHRAQLVATIDPASIPAPACPETIGVDGISTPRLGVGPVDGIDRYWIQYTDNVALPSPLVAAVTCRYVAAEGGARLAEVREERGDLTALQRALNETFGIDNRWPECASGIDSMGTAVPDVILVADAVGEMSEFWVFLPGTGAPCAAAFSDPPAYLPSEELVAHLEDAFGY
jgi:hypothetical protein